MAEPDKPAPLRACARCHAVQYCSKGCQAEDWPRHKRAVCDKVRAHIALYVDIGYVDLGPCSAAETAEAMTHYAPCGELVYLTFRKVLTPAGARGIARLHLHPPGSSGCADSPAAPPTVRSIVID